MTLVGHDQVLAFFDDALSEMARCRFVEVVGEPGTGRTRLLREVCRLARARGVPAWYGRADGSDRAFGVVVDAGDDHVDLPGRTGGALGTDRHAVRALLTAHADRTGLVLALDDMHSADESSVALVASLLLDPPSAPMLVVTASPPDQLLSVAYDSALRDGTACRVTLAADHVPYLETCRQAHAGDEVVAALLVAAARRVRDHFPCTAAQCLKVALKLIPPEAIQDRLELQLELAATGPSRECAAPC
jgi:hypothetical protein